MGFFVFFFPSKQVILFYWGCAIFDNVWGGVTHYSYAISICVVLVKAPVMIQDSHCARHRMKMHSQPQSARYLIDFAVSLHWIPFYYYFCIFLLFLILLWLLNIVGLFNNLFIQEFLSSNPMCDIHSVQAELLAYSSSLSREMFHLLKPVNCHHLMWTVVKDSFGINCDHLKHLSIYF